MQQKQNACLGKADKYNLVNNKCTSIKKRESKELMIRQVGQYILCTSVVTDQDEYFTKF